MKPFGHSKSSDQNVVNYQINNLKNDRNWKDKYFFAGFNYSCSCNKQRKFNIKAIF